MFENDENKECPRTIEDAGTDKTVDLGSFENNDPTAEQPAIDAEDGGGKQPKRKGNRRKVVIGAAIVAVVAGLGIGIWALDGSQPQASEPANTAQEQEATDRISTGIVRFGIEAPNWNEKSSPFIAHVTGETDEGEQVDFYHAVWADGSTDTVELAEGTYQVAWTSAINADGSIYRTPDQPTEIVVAGDSNASGTDEGTADGGAADQAGDEAESDSGEIAGSESDASGSEQDQNDANTDNGQEEADESQGEETDGGAGGAADGEDATDIKVPVIDSDESFEQVPAEDVTQDDLDQILGEIGEAVGNGDETLSGDAGQDVIDSATENTGNNPNADKEEIEQAGEEASGNVSEEPQTPSGTGSSGSSSGSGSGSGSTGGSSSSSGSTGGGSTSGSGSGSSSSHTHNWVAQTEQQWVQDSAAYDEQVWVEDSAAWTETVQTGSHIECSCGQTFSNTTEWNAHNKAQGAGNQHSYSVVPTYETIYHEATGHYETVHHDATGHYETVTTGYKCSSCGATR